MVFSVTVIKSPFELLDFPDAASVASALRMAFQGTGRHHFMRGFGKPCNGRRCDDMRRCGARQANSSGVDAMAARIPMPLYLRRSTCDAGEQTRIPRSGPGNHIARDHAGGKSG